jgi:hypothetical protein
MTQPWLSDDELRDLTGYVRPTAQQRWLTDNGIKCYRNGLNKIRVSRDALSAMKARTTERRTEPDFTKVRRAG